MLRLDARLGEIWGFSPLIFVRGHFWEIGIAGFLFRVKSHHVEKFRKYRLADVGKSELGKEKIKKKHAQNIRSTVCRTGDLIRRISLMTNHESVQNSILMLFFGFLT